jgi:tetratricopeptide (TPR) repeat protein
MNAKKSSVQKQNQWMNHLQLERGNPKKILKCKKMTTNKYYFQALDNFPYNLEETMQALNYALSYDDHNAESLCLLGRVYSEMLQDYETAKSYFEEAMQVKLDSVSTPLFYIDCLLNNEDYEEAKKLIDYAEKIKGIDKSRILYRKAIF